MLLTRLRSFIRYLSVDINEQRRLGAALILLIRSRIWFLYFLSPFFSRLPYFSSSKLFLWHCLSKVYFSGDFSSISCKNLSDILVPLIRQTHSYQLALTSLQSDRNGFLQRGRNYMQLSSDLLKISSSRILIFHHFDPFGYFPLSWIQALTHIQSSGWQVIISSSFIDPRFIDQLQDSGIKLAFRHNIGFCLGAYRDLSLLLKSSSSLSNRITSLAFINDSNLLIHPPSVLTDYLNQLTLSEEYKPVPILAGLTDSAQLNSYHIQSFFLYANKALLDSPHWFRFWSNLAVDSPKEKLILNGEIGLSQYLLSYGITLKVLFPLVKNLLYHYPMSEELLSYGIHQPHDVNQTLFAWRSLLERGYPFVKKHVLFQLFENGGHRLTIADLASFIPADKFDLIAEDINQLFINRNSCYPSDPL